MALVTEKKTLKPMYLWESLLWFGAWAVILFISTYGFMPCLMAGKMSDFDSFFLAMTVPMALMFIAAWVLGRLNGQNSLKDMGERYRMRSFSMKDVAWGIGAGLVSMAGMGLFSVLGAKVIDAGLRPVPKGLPLLLDPHAEFSQAALDQAVGGKILGNWPVLLKYFVMLFFNITGEELFWRGYVLPRQELAFGRNAWWIHGILWALYHSFKWWDVVSLVPVCLVIAFAAQKRKSFWPGFIAHYMVNGMGFLLFFTKVTGIL